ncbi:uncharacterized protein LOC123541332 [Mercenaria mercenaria]|uniref:uncharacterized protein LOC123541332 n=1 Tax=Mercenaria mercenaria TaxID=6596 RepID=UPI00234E4500|nr:uncharacterized protein LOC123541332 [Mercenaria mercenaria]
MRIHILKRCFKVDPFHRKRRSLSSHYSKQLTRLFNTEPNGVLKLSEEVESALHAGRPLVALETTIITHGMPYPDNISTATEVENIVRDGGAVPATIGILNGRIHIGLSKQQLEFLADPNTTAVKTSRRDLPFVISQGLHGGTTVSGTMVAAHMAGIQIFVTGGIGGVHRGAESSMDISADLTELARTPVTVISAGIKSILDIGRTLEYLETEGVNVSAFGRTTKEFPAFFTRKSGYKAPYTCETARQAAEMIYARERMGLQTGSLVAVPIPEEFDNIGQEIETVIQSVVKEASKKNIQGKEITPYILQRVNDLTQGKSLKANIELIKNNTTVGAKIAVELKNVQNLDKNTNNSANKSRSGSQSTTVGRTKQSSSSPGIKNVCVVGGSIVDFTARMSTADFKMNGGTYPGTVKQSFGGVGRNIADGLSRLDVDTLFISAIGNDSHRTAFEAHCKHMNLDAVARLDDQSTATYCAMLKQNGELMFGIGDMDIHQQITPQYISNFEENLSTSSLVCIDGNLSVEAIEYVCLLCARSGIPVLFDPADVHKATKPFLISQEQPVTYASPNFNELKMMASYLSSQEMHITGVVDDLDLDTAIHECTTLLQTVSTHVSVILVTLGKHGVVLCRRGDRNDKLPLKGDPVQMKGGVVMDHYPATAGNKPPSQIVSVSGAGDCMIAAFIAQLLQGQETSQCVKAGLLAGQISLQSSQAVPSNLTPHAVSGQAVQQQMDVTPREITFS